MSNNILFQDLQEQQHSLASVYCEGREGRMTYADPSMPWYLRWFIHIVEVLTGRIRLALRYRKVRPILMSTQGIKVWDRAAEAMNIQGPHWPSASDLAGIRRPGRGLLIVANHPFGVIDGVALSWLSSRLDENFLVIATGVLCVEANLNRYILPIDFTETHAAKKRNVMSRKLASARLAAGGVVSLFPSGGVSWIKCPGEPEREEPWKPMAGKLIAQTNCDVLGVHFSGSNSPLFHWLSRRSLVYRQALFLREARRNLDRECRFQLLPPLRNEAIPTDGTPTETAVWVQNNYMQQG